MSDTTEIAVVGIVVSGVLGPAVAALWAWRAQLRQFRHERSIDQREDLRMLLDDGAQVLGSGVTRLRSAAQGEAPPDLADWSREVHLTGERLLLRLDPDSLAVRRYMGAKEALTVVAETASSGEGSGPYEAAVDSFIEQRLSFLAAARELVGPTQ